MNRFGRALKVATVALVGLALSVSFSTNSFGDSVPQVVGQQVLGSTVVVRVNNPSSQAKGATVQVQAVVLGVPVSSSAHVNLAPGQTANVPVAFLSLVQGTPIVGLILDDSNPV